MTITWSHGVSSKVILQLCVSPSIIYYHYQRLLSSGPVFRQNFTYGQWLLHSSLFLIEIVTSQFQLKSTVCVMCMLVCVRVI